MYISDPGEILENQIERQMDLVDENNTYPCCKCGRKFHVDDMHSISSDPSSPLECGLNDCANAQKVLEGKDE